ncbi:TOBE-like domain-containing protein [Lichenihabitans sp. Uapishka_5]|uniref:sulfate/molybdate ABC transporter ATP-binding protein n=1 Tax=Lichenihabitans sp. Uapishka_5 TaxID=3037302 RepID=UPI0029E81012|nr:TOBE-like domain-containing protein [Lichenihabitans sp. Uapishka_5]MDX7952920.1 TOBE-like domain-containing protein [Lichenihabitans sp. Uapishka_5]
MSITVRGISKSFGPTRVLSDVDLAIATGELVALLGPSGSGKTTLLRVIAGMEAADPGSGAVLFDEQDITARGIGERRIGFVFQHYALFKTMTVFENIAFGLRSKPWRERPSEAQIRGKVGELLDLIQLQPLAQRFPSQLSGGQRQRVALARALAVEPRVLLLDEPFGALDATVRRDLRRWLRKLHETIHVTTIFVTHDQEEALEVSDRVAVMRSGRIEQFGSPQEVYEHPASPFVFQFLGHYNVFSARQAGTPPDTPVGADDRPGQSYVRPHDVLIARVAAEADAIAARVQHVGLVGSIVRVELQRLDQPETIDAELTLEASKALGLKTGETVFVTSRHAQVFEDYAI